MTDDLIPCDDCAELIPASATVCPICGSARGPSAPPTESPTPTPTPEPTPRSAPQGDAALPPPTAPSSRHQLQIAAVVVLFIALLFADRRVRDRVGAFLEDLRPTAATPAADSAAALPAPAAAPAAPAAPWAGEFVIDSQWTESDMTDHRVYIALSGVHDPNTAAFGTNASIDWWHLVDDVEAFRVVCRLAEFDVNAVFAGLPMPCTNVRIAVNDDGRMPTFGEGTYYGTYASDADTWTVLTGQGTFVLRRRYAPDPTHPDSVATGQREEAPDEADPSDTQGRDKSGGQPRPDGVPLAPDQAYFDYQVERPVAPIPGTGSPRYPDILRSAGVEGEVLAQFVVDTTGRVEIGSFKVLRSSHELFEAAVRIALPSMRFLPAEVGGRKVRQLVQQPFVFALSR